MDIFNSPVIASAGAAFVTAVLSVLVTGLLKRRLTSSEAKLNGSEAELKEAEASRLIVSMATDAAKDLIDSYQKQLDSLEERNNAMAEEVSAIRLELKTQRDLVGKLDEVVVKLRLAVYVYYRQLIISGVTPLFDLDLLEETSVKDLNELVNSLSSH